MPGSRGADAARASVLVVEPDGVVAERLESVLASAGYAVTQAASGAEAEALSKTLRPDLYILDRSQTDIDGLVLIARLQSQTSAAIILLDDPGHTTDVVLGLKLGADDVISKPFDAQELEARVEVVLRRSRGRAGRRWRPRHRTTLRVGELTLDYEHQTARLGDTVLALTATEFRLLWLLARNRPIALTHAELAQLVWGSADDRQVRRVGAHLARLRAKLRASPTPAPLLERLVEEGYELHLTE
jgi:DNA-binding response OmpR family regulator